MQDIVYLVRPGENNEELRYSIRSLEKNFPNHGQIWIVGYCPTWINKDIVRVIYRTQVKRKWINTDTNMKSVCHHPDVSADFILMNDDFFIVNPIDEIPTYHRGSIDEVIALHENMQNGQAYAWSMRHTKVLLEKMGIKNPYSYELHVPMVINKQKYIEAQAKRLELEPAQSRINKRTLYGNYAQIGGTQIEDVKTTRLNGKRIPKDFPFISTNDESFKFSSIGIRLQEMFPRMSRYELVANKPLPDRRVKCAGCGNDIHIDHFAGMKQGSKGEELYCDALPCLLQLNEEQS